MLKKKSTINEKDYIGYGVKKRIRICKSCISEAKRQLKKETKKGSDKERASSIAGEIAFMNAALCVFKKKAVLDGPMYSRLVQILNKYYYRKYRVWLVALALLLALVFAGRLTDDLPFSGFPIIGDKDSGGGSVETMQIPGYDTQTVSEKSKYVQLKNVEENSVYLKYYVYENEERVYESQLIPPGNYCDRWNAYKDLKKGEHSISFDVKAYDSETTEECASAAVIPVKVIKE